LTLSISWPEVKTGKAQPEQMKRSWREPSIDCKSYAVDILMISRLAPGFDAGASASGV
jgi:hypothetical protein